MSELVLFSEVFFKNEALEFQIFSYATLIIHICIIIIHCYESLISYHHYDHNFQVQQSGPNSESWMGTLQM